MDYWEADQLCQKNKEFIFSLFPSGKIYTTFLPAEARNAIGKVGTSTEPVLHMLKKIGFVYKNQVDPFDGGPHLWANVDDILPIKKITHCQFAACGSKLEKSRQESGLLSSAKQRPGQYRAMAVQVELADGMLRLLGGPKERGERVAEKIAATLEIQEGDSVVFMPYY
jgi:arginine N-succinyltransferase